MNGVTSFGLLFLHGKTKQSAIMLRFGILLCLALSARGFELVKDTQYYVELVNSANTTWTAGYNFENSSIEYLKQFLGTEINQVQHLLPRYEGRDGDEDIKIPTTFDASKKWPKCPHIKHVRDQSACGSCWAVSAAAVMTDRLCIASRGTFKSPISAEHLMTCCSECTSDGNGCHGGSHFVAWLYAKTQGIVTGGDYHSHIGCQPYQLQPCEHAGTSKRVSCKELLPSVKTPACESKCLNPLYKKNIFVKDHQFMKEAFFITNDEKAIQREIMQRGPVAAAFAVYADFPAYKSGVYHRISDDMVGGHGVKIIGWGTEGGVDYWLVVNSWNTDWGDKGLFKIRRMTAGVDFEQAITFGVV